jgi:hypothetical protein
MRFSLVIQGIPVDLFSDETIQLTREIKDFQTTQAKTDFTQQFVIPSTPVNDPIFENYFDENAVLSGWNAFKKLDAKIFIHSIPIFDGCIELTAVEFRDGLPRQYNVIFYGQGKKAIADFGEKTLPQVDWSDYNHTVNYNAVIDSWFGNLLSGKVLYPIADWHIGLTYCKVPVVSRNLYSGGLAINDLRPAILLKEMVEACFKDIGYQLSGTLLSKTNFDDLFVIPMNGGGPVQNTNNEDAKINVSRNTINTPTVGSAYYPLVFNTVTSDPLNLYNTTSGLYLVPFTGRYTFRFTININVTNPNFTFISLGNRNQAQGLSFNTTGVFIETFIFDLNKGDTFGVFYSLVSGHTINTVQLEIIEVPYGIDGSTMNFSVVMPEMKVTDFVNGFLKTFNAILIPKSATEFELHNIDDYYALGVTKEYTDYIDMTDIRHEKVPIPKQISMNHTFAEDLANVAFKNLNNREYGSVKASPEVDFANEELTIESPFSIFPTQIIREQNSSNQVIRNTELQIPTFLDNDVKPVKANLWLCYFVERKTIVKDTYQLEGIDQYSYPLISPFQDFPTTGSTKSLGFGLEATLSGDAPVNTLYVDFFQKYLSRIFSSKSRIVYFDAIIPVGEWLNLQMNDTIAVSGNYYKIQRIEYDILNERAKLILFSYPNVEIQTYQTTGNDTGWTNGTLTPDGVTTMNGDAVGRGVTNTVNSLGGGQGLTVLGQNLWGDSLVQELRNQVAELLKGRSVFVVYNSDPVALNTPADNSYITIPLNTVNTLGETFYYTNSGGVVTINEFGRYKVTAEASIFHSKNKNLQWAILLNGNVTTAYADLEKSDYSTSVSEVFDLAVGQEVKVGISCYENSVVGLTIDWCKLRIEKL